MLLGQSISAFSFGNLINMPMVGYESCILKWLRSTKAGRRGPDPEIPGLKTWNPEMQNFKEIHFPKYRIP